MRRLKICMATTFYPPYNFGGDGIFVYRLSNALANQGHEVHVIHDLDAFALLSGRPPLHEYPHHPNVTVHPLDGGRAGKIDLLLTHQLGRPVLKHRRIKTILESHAFDVIHFHNISLLGGPHLLRYGQALKLCTLNESWFVCAMHVLWRFDREPCTRRTCLACTLHGRRPPQLWRYTGAIGRAVKAVDACIAPSRFTRHIYHEHVFPAEIRHIPYFMPDHEVVDERPAPAYPSRQAPERPYFLYVGRLEKIKGVQVLIEAFRGYDCADLVIAGTGDYEITLKEMAAGLPHVHFLGMLDHAALRPLYTRAIATLVPSLCYETFGWPVLESFAMRTPVIAHDLSAPAEIVEKGKGGLLYRTPAELLGALERLRTEPGLRQALGDQGYRSYKTDYTEARHLQRYGDLICELNPALALTGEWING